MVYKECSMDAKRYVSMLDYAAQWVGEAEEEVRRRKELMAPVAEGTLITLDEAALITKRSYRTIQNWVSDDTLPEVERVGGRILVSRERAEHLRDNPPKTGRPAYKNSA
jgi:hypothetical protein